jgi:uncharacterized protein YbjT (DUF2867 family)
MAVVALLRQRGRTVRAMAHHDDDRADALRALGADVVVGDLTRPADVATALGSGPNIGRVFELTGPRSQDMNGIAEEYARALNRPVSYIDVPWETWAEQGLARAALGSYVEEHLATVARLHRENRYDRMTTTVEEITGRPAESVEEFVTRRSDLFAEGHAATKYSN